MKNIMKVLTTGVSLEQEFEVKKSITAIKELTDIEELKPYTICLLYTSPSPRDGLLSRMPSSA